jgi:hypothetical protein
VRIGFDFFRKPAIETIRWLIVDDNGLDVVNPLASDAVNC